MQPCHILGPYVLIKAKDQPEENLKNRDSKKEKGC